MPIWLKAICFLGVLVFFGCATPQPAPEDHGDASRSAAPKSQPVVLPLRPYQAGLLVVDVEIAGKLRPFLLDTGSGITIVSPTLAKEMGCTPSGRLTGHRMHGQRVDMERCRNLTLTLGGVPIAHKVVGVIDIATFLPPDWAPLDGAISLASLRGRAFTLELAAKRLTLETDSSLQSRVKDMKAIQVRSARPAGGAALDVFAAVDSPAGPWWLLIDTANVAKTILAPHTTRSLGIAAGGASSPEKTEPIEASIRLSGSAPRAVPVVIQDIIYDGNLGASFWQGYTLTLNLGTEQGWISLHP